jgi:hypothetical protein
MSTDEVRTDAGAEDQEVIIAAEVIEDLLHLVEPNKRLDVLNELVTRETAARKDRVENGPLKWMKFDDASVAAHEASPGWRYWNHIMRFKSLVIQVFTRNITNNHSPADAAKILFMQHRNGAGSRWLPDYLDGLPAIKVDLTKAAKIAEEAATEERTRLARRQQEKTSC